MKMTRLFILAVALAGCATSQGIPGNGQTSRTATCQRISEQEVKGLFERWNRSLQTFDSNEVVANYAEQSILLPTVSNEPRLTSARKKAYFDVFLTYRPFGRIDPSSPRLIEIGCNSVVDAGLYKFTYNNGTGKKVCARYTFTYNWNGTKWLITSHHSSEMPEAAECN